MIRFYLNVSILILACSIGVSRGEVTIDTPVSRQIVQRDSSNQGDLQISGQFLGSPDRIEARAIVVASGNSGVDTN